MWLLSYKKRCWFCACALVQAVEWCVGVVIGVRFECPGNRARSPKSDQNTMLHTWGVDAYEFYLPVAILKLFLSFFLFWSNDLWPCLCFYYLSCAKKLVFFRGAEKLVKWAIAHVVLLHSFMLNAFDMCLYTYLC